MTAKTIGKVATPYGEGAIVTREYGTNGALAVVIEPHICTLSVNLDHGQPCVQSGDLPADHFYVDTNNVPEKMLNKLLESGHFEATDLPEGVSGYCTYPVWKLVSRATSAA